MTTTKSLIVAALLTGVAAVSFAQAPESATPTGTPSASTTGTPSASTTKTVHHKKHHRHAHHDVAATKAAPAGK
jgi:hypothetical protein